MLYQVYWRNLETREVYNGYVKAKSRNEAYDIVANRLRNGFQVTTVYKATANQITPQSLTINFANWAEYKLF